ncbi:hypothetical protein [Aestuariibaculum sediminum]|uniref:Uncharacterized protein n=1 Tax=Aestuariibaculum sediminum TaxID=2770637 RepID=A0A8J6QAD5_9FLAO|nr:hypothetical protein [Aestuariibaculum sediminum]MBD0833337.1 hypothetical protein [Aestuariibaculum sediminum]
MKKAAYLDNNIFVDIEQNSLSTIELMKNIDHNITDFFYSASHLHEANEITAKTNSELKIRLEKRFRTISSVTNNNYLFQELPSNKVYKLKEEPNVVFDTINDVPFAQNMMKRMVNTVSEVQRAEFRKQLNIDPMRINNYSPKEVIEQINSKRDLIGGFSLVGMIEKAIEFHPQGKEMGLHNRFAGIFEMLDMVGYWKDKYNEKSNYARLWDASHCHFSSYCDYFISNDKRTRNKAKVVFEIYRIETKVLDSKGNE